MKEYKVTITVNNSIKESAIKYDFPKNKKANEILTLIGAIELAKRKVFREIQNSD